MIILTNTVVAIVLISLFCLANRAAKLAQKEAKRMADYRRNISERIKEQRALMIGEDMR